MTRDIKPATRIAALRRTFTPAEQGLSFPFDLICALVGMQPTFVKKVVGKVKGQ